MMVKSCLTLALGLLLVGGAQADDRVFEAAPGSYTNLGAQRFRKTMRTNSEGSIYNVVPPPPRKTAPKRVLSGAHDLFSYEQSALQNLPARMLTYFVRVEENAPWQPARMNLSSIIMRAAHDQGIDPLIVELIIKHESAFNNHAVSRSGATGLMQLMPITCQALGVTDPLDPVANVTGGTRYFAEQWRRYGDLHLALAAYNAGPGNVAAYGGVPPFPETLHYVESISTEYQQLRRRQSP